MDKKWLWIGAAFLAGVVLSGKVRTLPLGNKIPTL